VTHCTLRSVYARLIEPAQHACPGAFRAVGGKQVSQRRCRICRSPSDQRGPLRASVYVLDRWIWARAALFSVLAAVLDRKTGSGHGLGVFLVHSGPRTRLEQLSAIDLRQLHLKVKNPVPQRQLDQCTTNGSREEQADLSSY
jgi:hypothetical protein